MLRQCITLAIIGCAWAAPQSPQHQYQAQQAEVPPHLLRQYIGVPQVQQQQPAATQILTRPVAAHAPSRLPYAIQADEQQYQQYQPQPQSQYQPQPQSQPQPHQYRAQPQPQYRPQPQPQPQPQYQPQYKQQQQAERDPQEDYDPNPSYQFGFDVNDDQYTNYQNRKEQREGNVIKGSYSVVDSDGFIRTVTYTADPKEGFKAEVSRQPTDIVVKIPTPKPQLQQIAHQPQQLQHRPSPQQAPAPQYYRYEQQ